MKLTTLIGSVLILQALDAGALVLLYAWLKIRLLVDSVLLLSPWFRVGTGSTAGEHHLGLDDSQQLLPGHHRSRWLLMPELRTGTWSTAEAHHAELVSDRLLSWQSRGRQLLLHTNHRLSYRRRGGNVCCVLSRVAA